MHVLVLVVVVVVEAVAVAAVFHAKNSKRRERELDN